MRRSSFMIAGLLALSVMAALTHAQAPGRPLTDEARARLDEARARLIKQMEFDLGRIRRDFDAAQREGRTTCKLPDESAYKVNDVVRYEGQRYRCVEIFAPTPPLLVPPGENQTLTIRTAGWVKI